MRGRSGERRSRGGFRQPNHRSSIESFKWRLSLHSVYVSNISYRVSRKDLWEIFNEFGVVVDVFLPSKKYHSSFSFAFVRYRHESEMRQAIYKANGRNLFGRLIVVRKAIARKADRASMLQNSDRHVSQKVRKGSSFFSFHRRNHFRRFVSHESHVYRPRIRGHEQKKAGESPDNGKSTFQVTTVGIPMVDNIGVDTVVAVRKDPCPTSTALNQEDSIDQVADSSMDDLVNQKVSEEDLDEELDLDVFIPEEHRNWLERCFVVTMTSEKNVSIGISRLSNTNLKLQFFELSNMMILVSVEDEDLLEEGIKYVYENCKDLISGIDPWESTGFRRSSIVWLQLSDVPLELWHPNFFSALGNSWGNFLKIDDFTNLKKSFKMARMQILTSNLSEIPLVACGYALGIKFKIGVSVERNGLCLTAIHEALPVFPIDDMDGNPNLNTDKVALGDNKEFNDGFSQGNIHSDGVLADATLGNDAELASSKSKRDGLPACDLVIYEGASSSVEEIVAETSEEIHVSDPGLHLSPFSSSPEENELSMDLRSDDGFINQKGVKLKRKLGRRHCWSKCKVCKKNRRKLTRRGVTKLILGNSAKVDLDSDISLSDVDIRSRNEIILKEAEATFEVSQALGIEFLESRCQVVSKLADLDRV